MGDQTEINNIIEKYKKQIIKIGDNLTPIIKHIEKKKQIINNNKKIENFYQIEKQKQKRGMKSIISNNHRMVATNETWFSQQDRQKIKTLLKDIFPLVKREVDDLKKTIRGWDPEKRTMNYKNLESSIIDKTNNILQKL